MSLIKNKLGQVSIFMIISLIIVIGGAMFFYLTRPIDNLGTEVSIIEEQVPFQFDQVKSFVVECIRYVSTDGIKKIGNQGGYVSLTDRTLNKQTFAMRNDPTESEVVEFAKNSDLKIPYWYYLESSNNCENNCNFDSKRPDLRDTENSIEKQLERYIDINFKNCVNGYEDLKEQGFEIIENSQLESDVTITNEDVVVTAKYEIEAKKQDSSIDLSQFLVRLPVNMAKVYDLATKITNLEIEHKFLEKHVLNMIVAFSGIDSEKLPPMSEMQFKFGSKNTWHKTELKNKVTGMLTSYVSMFQVDGAYNYDRNLFSSQLSQRLYDSAIIPIANFSYSDLSVDFTYLDFWPAYFNLNCKGERCSPSSANGLMSIFGIQDYRFNYDLSFPVMVEIRDESAFNGQGYNFGFFLEGNVRNNKPMDTSFKQLGGISFSGRSQLCDVIASGDVSINVVDKLTKNPIDDAQVLYTLLGESCFIGATENGKTVSKFPIALGGSVNVIHDQHVGKSIEFDAKFNQQGNLNFELDPIKAKKLIVLKKNIVKTLAGWQFADIEFDLSEKETASITLNRISSDNENEFSTAAQYKIGEPSEIDIAPGDYEANIALLSRERIVIPSREECTNILGGILGKKCVDLPRIDLGEGMSQGNEEFTKGGLIMNITISPDDFDKETLVLYVVAIDLGSVPEQNRVLEDLDQVSRVEDFSNKNKAALLPRFQ